MVWQWRLPLSFNVVPLKARDLQPHIIALNAQGKYTHEQREKINFGRLIFIIAPIVIYLILDRVFPTVRGWDSTLQTLHKLAIVGVFGIFCGYAWWCYTQDILNPHLDRYEGSLRLVVYGLFAFVIVGKRRFAVLPEVLLHLRNDAYGAVYVARHSGILLSIEVLHSDPLLAKIKHGDITEARLTDDGEIEVITTAKTETNDDQQSP